MNSNRTNYNLGGLFLSAFLASLLVMSLVSCDHKELKIPVNELSQVRVNFDYTDVEQTPKAMRVLFFPTRSDHSPYKFDIPDSGGYVRLPAGDYQVIAYNVDTETVIENDDDNYGNFSLTTQSYDVEITNEDESDKHSGISMARSLFGANVPKGRDEGKFLLYDSPEWTCICHADAFNVETSNSSSPDKTKTLTLHATTAVCVVDLIAEGIEGVEYATMVRGTLSGIAAGRFVADDCPTSDPGMVSFVANVDREEKVIKARFYVWDFQPIDNPDVKQYLNLYIWSNTGNYYMSADVTDVMNGAGIAELTLANVRLKLQLTIMEVDEGNSGFKPQLDEWEEQNSEIKL